MFDVILPVHRTQFLVFFCVCHVTFGVSEKKVQDAWACQNVLSVDRALVKTLLYIFFLLILTRYGTDGVKKNK